MNSDEVSLYKELSQEYRVVLMLFWEVPSIVVGIAGILISAAYYFDIRTYSLARASLLGFASSLLAIALIAARKHRVAGRCYIHELKRLENKIIKEKEVSKSANPLIPRATSDFEKYVRAWRSEWTCNPNYKDKPPNWGWFEKRSAQRGLLLVVAFLLVSTSYLTLWELLKSMGVSFPYEPQLRVLCGLFLIIITLLWSYFRLD